MRSGISYPSYGREMGWSASGPAPGADYPLANLALLDDPRRVMAMPYAAGTPYLQGTMPSSRMVDFFSFVHHNAPAGATFRIVLYNGALGATPYRYDSGNVPFWPGGSTPNPAFLATTPHILPALTQLDSIYIGFSEHPTGWEIGAIEIGQFWAWSDVAVPREIGIRTGATSAEVGQGVEHVTRGWAPRTVAGSREVVDRSELDTKLLDFQRDTGLWKSFVWCWDVDDPATWAREAMLVTNTDLIPGQSSSNAGGRLAFSFTEKL